MQKEADKIAYQQNSKIAKVFYINNLLNKCIKSFQLEVDRTTQNITNAIEH